MGWKRERKGVSRGVEIDWEENGEGKREKKGKQVKGEVENNEKR